MDVAVYPGSFDPLTYGHLGVAERASKLTKKLIVAVAVNPLKDPLFSPEERVALVRQATSHLPNVEVDMFGGLLVDYAKDKHACAVIRGLRAVSDFDYEFQMALTNRKLSEDFETVFLVTSENYSYLSSTIIKQIARLGGDIRSFVPDNVARRVKEVLSHES